MPLWIYDFSKYSRRAALPALFAYPILVGLLWYLAATIQPEWGCIGILAIIFGPKFLLFLFSSWKTFGGFLMLIDLGSIGYSVLTETWHLIGFCELVSLLQLTTGFGVHAGVIGPGVEIICAGTMLAGTFGLIKIG